MPSKSSKSKKRGGGMFSTDPNDPNANRTWGEWASSMNPLGTKKTPVQPVSSQVVSPPAPLPEPLKAAVVESQEMAKTAGRRLKKHMGGYDIASGKSMRKLFGTAKGDYMLGGKRRRRKTRRHH
jgi:hypothetical protein